MSAAARFTAALVLTAACLYAPHSALGSAGSIVATRTVAVSSDAPANPYAESFLAIDPRNPASFIVTALTIGNGTLNSALYESQDGGAYWTRIRTGGRYDTADPLVYFAPDGRAFFESERSGGLSVMTSGDGGKTWTPFRYTRVGLHFDRPYMGFVAEGTFAGRPFFDAYVPEHAKAALGIPADVLVEPDGAILLPYVYTDFDLGARARAPARYEVLVSHDGGPLFSKAVTAAHLTMLSGVPMSAPIPRTEPPVRTQRDLAAQERLQIVSGNFDPHRGRFTVALRIKNVSSAPIRGPFAVVFERAMANLPNLRATNADTTRDKRSAWILGTAAPLLPGAATAPRSATWRFSGYPKAPRYPVFVFRVEQVRP